MPSSESSPRTFYTSTFHVTVDGKRRIQVPKRWRSPDQDEELAVLIWKTPDQQEACLLVLPPEPFQELVNKVKAMPYSDPKAESLRRWLGKNSTLVVPDKSGRVCLPEFMANMAGIQSGGEAVAVGLMDRWQLWSPERWGPRSDMDDDMQSEALKLI